MDLITHTSKQIVLTSQTYLEKPKFILKILDKYIVLQTLCITLKNPIDNRVPLLKQSKNKLNYKYAPKLFKLTNGCIFYTRVLADSKSMLITTKKICHKHHRKYFSMQTIGRHVDVKPRYYESMILQRTAWAQERLIVVAGCSRAQVLTAAVTWC